MCDTLGSVPQVVYYDPQGADALASFTFTQPSGCGWTFMGCAMPLVEHPDTLQALDDSVFAARPRRSPARPGRATTRTETGPTSCTASPW